MIKRDPLKVFAISTVGLLGVSLSASIASANGPPNRTGTSTPATASVPKAQCSPGDRIEGGLQGQTTPQERASGDSALGYNCNLDLVGQFRGDGALSQNGPTYFGDCAYYATADSPLQEQRGVVVVDASDASKPMATAYLDDTKAMANPHETLRAHVGRKLLAAAENNGPNFAVYDLSTDCRHPSLLSSIELPGSVAHMGNFAPDGRTYYVGQNNRGIGGKLYPVDLDDPANPKELSPWTFNGNGRPHGVWLNKDGTRLYAGQPGLVGNTGSSVGPDGLVIDDVSDYQFRLPNPQIRIVSMLFWGDQGQAEEMYPIEVHGRHYVVSTDESGGAGGVGGITGACNRHASAFGYPNIIDVTDESNPKIVAKIMLEVNDPANCATLAGDPPDAGGGAPAYNVERCTANRTTNPTLLACGFQNAGLRVFDISDIFHPKEIAYYKPPAPGTAFLPGSGSWKDGVNTTVDKIAGYMHFHTVVPGQGDGHGNGAGATHGPRYELWTVSDGNGFQVLRFSDDFVARHHDLFQGASN